MQLLRYLWGPAIILSAALLFWAQPMFTKQVLPLLGGSPAVWNTCMVCYQFTLLLGYAYAHLIAQRLRRRTHVILHLALLWGVLLLASFRLPEIAPSTTFPAWRVARLFFVSLGPAFFLLSTTTPLLHAWFQTFSEERRFPLTRFYAFSNFGSLAALLSYPILIEPFLRLSAQTAVWRTGYGLLALMLSGCGLAILWQGRKENSASKDAGDPTFRSTGFQPAFSASDSAAAVTWRQHLHWVALAAVPSGLLLSVTQYITTDIAPIPLFWVIPLSLYLLTFILAFAGTIPYGPIGARQALTGLLVPVFMIALGQLRTVIWLDMGIHLTALFVVALACHGELAQRKPAPQHLTEFYFWMSVGGVVGGVFTTFAAPALFDTLLEYPLLTACACGLCPLPSGRISVFVWKLFGISVLAAFMLFPLTYLTRDRDLIVASGIGSLLLICALGGLIGIRLLGTSRRIALGLGSFGVMALLMLHSGDVVTWRDRNFWGVMKITATDIMRVFYHGTTQHGAQLLALERRAEPLTYFHQEGPIGHLFRSLPDQPARAIAVLGLGIGTLAAYARPEDTFTFYELDPQIVTVATNPRWFTYLQDCRGQVRILTGDGRLMLANAPDQAYTLIIQDAFSSDTIPVHLLTREAFALYVAKLSEHGLLVFNLTNRYLDVTPVVASLIHDSGMVGVIWRDKPVNQTQQAQGHYPSVWVVTARSEADLAVVRQIPSWQPLTAPAHSQVWTDDYSNLLSTLKIWKKPKTQGNNP